MSTTRRTLALAAAGGLGWLGWRALRGGAQADLTGDVVLITGGSRGLGLLLAREFARHGCRVAICARDERELDHARADLERRGADVLAARCDVTDREQVERLIADVEQRFGRLDIVVNNASIIQVGPLETMTPADFEDALAVNFLGTVYTTLAALPGLRARRSGRIVNITSIGGKVAIPHLLPYDAAKFAAVGFSEGLRAELQDDGIAVTTIVPGLMRTGSPVNAFFKGKSRLEYTWFSIGDALPGLTISAERAARAIVRATRRGRAEVTIGLPAKLLRLAHGLAPGAVTRVIARLAPLLPAADGAGRGQVRGMKLHTALSPSPITTLMNRAARKNNEFGGAPQPAPEHARKVGLDGRGDGRRPD